MKGLALNRETIRADLVASVVNAVTSIPDALGSVVLAGLNPIHGPYAIMVGTPVGEALTGSACAVAIIGLVQGAGVGRSYANLDGDYESFAAATAAVLQPTSRIGQSVE